MNIRRSTSHCSVTTWKKCTACCRRRCRSSASTPGAGVREIEEEIEHTLGDLADDPRPAAHAARDDDPPPSLTARVTTSFGNGSRTLRVFGDTGVTVRRLQFPHCLCSPGGGPMTQTKGASSVATDSDLATVPSAVEHDGSAVDLRRVPLPAVSRGPGWAASSPSWRSTSAPRLRRASSPRPLGSNHAVGFVAFGQGLAVLPQPVRRRYHGPLRNACCCSWRSSSSAASCSPWRLSSLRRVE